VGATSNGTGVTVAVAVGVAVGVGVTAGVALALGRAACVVLKTNVAVADRAAAVPVPGGKSSVTVSGETKLNALSGVGV